MHNFFLVLTSISGFILSLLARELHDLAPYFANKLIRRIASLLPSNQEQMEKAWLADLECIPGKLFKLTWAISLLKVPYEVWQYELNVSPPIALVNLGARRLRYFSFTVIFSTSQKSVLENEALSKYVIDSIRYKIDTDRFILSPESDRESKSEPKFSTSTMRMWLKFLSLFYTAHLLMRFTYLPIFKIDQEASDKIFSYIGPKVRERQCKIHEKNFHIPLFRLITGCTCTEHNCNHNKSLEY